MHHRNLCATVLLLSVSMPFGRAGFGQVYLVDNNPLTNGINVQQLSFNYFGGTSQSNSQWGQVTADPVQLMSNSGFSQGFLNVVMPGNRWVVQNLHLDAFDSYGPITGNFDLGSAGPQSLANARIEYSTSPIMNMTSGGELGFNVNPGEYNAQGAGDSPVTSVGLPNPANTFNFFPGGITTVNVSQPNVKNVQAATNQCFPMSIANSLQYLENRYGTGVLNVPHDHVKGLKGDNSLVGQLDTKANRNAPARNNGSGVWFVPMLQGKFDYLKMNNLDTKLVMKHRGVGYGGAGNQLPAGNFTHMGVTSTNDGMPISWQWICDELARGEDVEIVFTYDNAAGNPTGGHAVRVFECGTTLGIPWIGYAHDALQTDMDPMDTMGLETKREFLLDLDMDGLLNLGSMNREVRFAFSESVPEPGCLLSIGVFALCLLRRR